jgi:hypothetical protein
MEAVWTKLPTHLSDKICNLLPSLHPLPPYLKSDIESGAGWLNLFANRFKYYYHMDKWYIVAHALLVRLPEPTTTIERWNMRDYCQAIWYNMTWEQRSEILTGDYEEMIEELDEREAHWEEWNEARLNREDEYEYGNRLDI